MKAIEKLENANSDGKYICVGLDTEISKIPVHLKSTENPILEFNKQIIEATKNLAAAYKINLAFYESNILQYQKTLELTLASIPADVLIIADGKRGDIGNTSRLYAESVFNQLNFDAATLNPLMGKDSLEPFLHYSDKLNFILALTSNPGSSDFQKLKLNDGAKLYQHIIKKIKEWNENSNCGIVFGATNLEELSENLDLINALPLLIPGIGAQGGNLKDLCKILFSSRDKLFLINVSRGILYKSKNENFASAAGSELSSLNEILKASSK